MKDKSENWIALDGTLSLNDLKLNKIEMQEIKSSRKNLLRKSTSNFTPSYNADIEEIIKNENAPV
jgi:hypothetical protein